MKYTQSFIRTEKELPAKEDAKNAELLIRGGFIRKEMAGVYSYLPLGLRVLRKIEQIVREEMNAAGCVELLMPALSSKQSWVQTERWDVVDVLYKLEMADGKECALNPTHEEVVTPMARHFSQSPKDFPFCLYQIQTKFRNEPRAKSGILRGREFYMKDAYSFHLTQEDFDRFYNEVMVPAYNKVWKRLGIGDKTVMVAASGGDFSKYSHEFQTLSDVGEDEIYIDDNTKEAWNKEIIDEVPANRRAKLRVENAIEVGNIFPLSTKFSDAFGMKVDGKSVIMGCYGIGISRAMGTLVEVFHDDKGILWPKNVAPVQVYLAPIGKDDTPYKEAEKLYAELTDAGIEVLLDDRNVGPGQKFGDAELLGIPCRIVVSERTMAEKKVEFVDRATGETQMIDRDKVLSHLQKFLGA